jgi:hypothetical protein
MCKRPQTFIVDGSPQPRPCRNCEICEWNRKKHWIGKCVAEREVSDGVLIVNLTYANGYAGADTLIYADFQRLMKRLRKAKYKVRYLVAGEYGSKNGRAHWHAIMFFTGKVPEVEFDQEKYMWEFWPHGFTYFQNPDFRGFAYPLKYIQKDTSKDESAFNMSKKPVLGALYFEALARQYVERGLAPPDFYYSFPHITFRNGKKAIFKMTGKAKEHFVMSYLRQWVEIKGQDQFKMTQALQQEIDRIFRHNKVDLMAEISNIYRTFGWTWKPDDYKEDHYYELQKKIAAERAAKPIPKPSQWHREQEWIEEQVDRSNEAAYLQGYTKKRIKIDGDWEEFTHSQLSRFVPYPDCPF